LTIIKLNQTPEPVIYYIPHKPKLTGKPLQVL